MAVTGRDGGRKGDEVFGQTTGSYGKTGSPANTCPKAGESTAITTAENFQSEEKTLGRPTIIQGDTPMKRFVDLSISIESGLPSDPPIMIPKIDYNDHGMGANQMLDFFPDIRKDHR